MPAGRGGGVASAFSLSRCSSFSQWRPRLRCWQTPNNSTPTVALDNLKNGNETPFPFHLLAQVDKVVVAQFDFAGWRFRQAGQDGRFSLHVARLLPSAGQERAGRAGVQWSASR